MKKTVILSGLMAVLVMLLTKWAIDRQNPGSYSPEHFKTPAHIGRSVEVTANPSLDIQTHLDAHWYLDIAVHGYQVLPGQSNVVFFPLYPYLVRALYRLTNLEPAVAAHIVSKLLTVLMAMLLAYYLAGMWPEFPKGVQARTAALVGVTALLVHPVGFVAHMIYTESLFMCLSTGLFIAYSRRHMPALFLLSFLLALSRPQGLFLPVAFLGCDLMMSLWRRQLLIARTTLAVAFGAAAAIVTFASILLIEVGDPFVFWTKRATWDPDASFLYLFRVFAPTIGPMNLLPNILLYSGLVGCFLLWRLGRREMACYCILLLLLPLQKGNVGDLTRYSMLAIYAYVPILFWMLRRPEVAVFSLAMAAILYGVNLQRWLDHYWVG